jgi:hypothetical protein
MRWTGGYNGFVCFNLTTLAMVTSVSAALNFNPAFHSFIMSMTFDKDNNFYYTINDGGAYKYNFNTSSYTDYTSQFKHQFSHKQSYGIALDASNKIAVMTDNSSDNSGIRTVANIGTGSQDINNFGYGLFKFGPRGNAPGNYNHHRIMQVMPNGNILVPDMNNNRVCIVGSTPVGPIPPTITGFSVPAKAVGDAPFSITAPTSNSSGSFTYTSSNTDVATISGSSVTIVTAGNTTITANQAAAGNFTQGSATTVLTVEDLSIYNVTNLEWGSGNQGLLTATRTNLIAWYDATVSSSYTLSNQGGVSRVSQLNDLSGQNHHLIVNNNSTVVAGPMVNTTNSYFQINGLPAFGFEVDAGLRSNTNVPLAEAITIFMVIRNKTDYFQEYGNFMHHGDRDTDWSLERNGFSTFLKFESGNNNDVGANLTANVNYILIGRLSKNPSKREFWRYSDTQSLVFSSATTPVQISAGSKPIFFGKSSYTGNTESCNSYIGEVIYYKAAISDTDIESNRQYLQKKWFDKASLSKYEKNVSFTMAVKPSNATYKYRYELISNDVVIKTSVIDWVSNQTTTILNDNLNFATLYTFKVSLVNSGNTQVMTPGVTSGSFTTPTQS